MNRETWLLIRRNKNFNVRVFRLGLGLLLASLTLSSLQLVGIFYVYVNLPEPDYYATNGETPPQQLQALATANKGSEALLGPDPVIVNREKVIPQ